MISFFVPGIPAPQGSKSGYIRGGRVVLVESSKKVKPWRKAVSECATTVYNGTEPIDGPVEVVVVFFLPRPKSLPKRIIHMVKKPDLDKLVRSTLDGLSGIAYVDDNRVSQLTASKTYQDPDHPPGALITITPITAPPTSGAFDISGGIMRTVVTMKDHDQWGMARRVTRVFHDDVPNGAEAPDLYIHNRLEAGATLITRVEVTDEH